MKIISNSNITPEGKIEEYLTNNFLFVIMLVLISLLALSSINVIATEIDVSGINGEELKDAYSELNIRLVKDVPSADIEATMNAAKDFLSKNGDEKKASSIGENIESGSPKLNEANKLFVALSQLNDKNRCDAKAINVLKQNDQASGGRSHSILAKGECRKRVETVLLDYAAKAKKVCPRVHSYLMSEKLSTFNKRQFLYIHHLTDSTITSCLADFKQANLPRKEGIIKLAFHKMLNRLTQDFYYHLWEVLDKFAPDQKEYLKPIDDESTGLKKLDEAKIKELFNEYGMEPCKAYVAAFGPDLYEPEIYLSTFGHEPLRGDEDFYLNWTRYNMCKVYIQNEAKLWQDVMFNADI